MKKLLLAFCAVTVLTALAEDSYLYWMVNDTISVDDKTYSWEDGSLTAKVVAYNSSTWRPGLADNGGESLLLYSAEGSLTSVGKSVEITGMNSSYYAGIASTMIGPNWSYFIELYNDRGFVGRSSEGVDYASVQSGQYLMGSDLKPGELWNVSAFTATPAPEPNSAMLLLIGCAALALRRRKQIAA